MRRVEESPNRAEGEKDELVAKVLSSHPLPTGYSADSNKRSAPVFNTRRAALDPQEWQLRVDSRRRPAIRASVGRRAGGAVEPPLITTGSPM